ncbi:MsnO8 family LLM class oxidoreductase [Nocardioides nanhaiensis]|uniref:MsnO8 family LLM class oxidoreductase n=1 Tax=Nocardioides nanhaiensis TaxID=1476871 RepID=A0ABP8VUH4_9ACTN
MRLSLLDRSRTRAGWSDAAAVTATVERAVEAEAQGYHRFWVAEHHAVPGIASSAPPVLLAAVGARTSRLRIGSGGVMLPLHQPLVVAEQFLLLEALHPGRVDLGLGRSLGFTPPVRRALRREEAAATGFEADLQELRGLLTGDGEVTARPATRGDVPMHVLAVRHGVAIAARLGLPVVVGGTDLLSDEVLASLREYRRSFRPWRGSAPSVTVSLDVTVAEDDATARDLALPEAWAMAQSRRTGEFAPLQPVRAIRDASWPAQVRERVEALLERAVAGSPARVRRHLEQLADRTGADELMASTSTFDVDALRESDRLLRDLVA